MATREKPKQFGVGAAAAAAQWCVKTAVLIWLAKETNPPPVMTWKDETVFSAAVGSLKSVTFERGRQSSLAFVLVFTVGGGGG